MKGSASIPVRCVDLQPTVLNEKVNDSWLVALGCCVHTVVSLRIKHVRVRPVGQQVLN